ncbi:MAG TPA: DMT family transporter, partial [Blastocatellia bacterium]|nr:DMT family transporter [Blastocatellia bacterium]
MKTSERGTAQVMSAMGFAVLALSSSSLLIIELERSSIPPLVISFYRMAIATAILLPAALMFRSREILSLARKDLALLLLGGLSLAVHFAAWITSLKYIPIATSVVLVNSHPIFVAIASYFFLGERVKRTGIVGILVGLSGMAVMSKDAFENLQLALKGDGLALLGALAVVGYFIVGRNARSRISLLGYVTPLYFVCSILLFGLVVISGDALGPYPIGIWGYLAALAIIPTIIGHSVFNWALKHVRPTVISLAFLGEPLAASLLALIFFAQRPRPAILIGGSLVLIGIYLTNL